MLNKLKFILITALPSLLFFFFLIPNADAASTYTIYAYGSGYIMVGILQSVASVVASGGFSLILKSVVLIGFVIIFLQMIITSFKVSPHRSLVKYFSAVLVIYSALLIPKVNVSVYDTVNNTTSNATVVSGVPWGIGAIASYFSDFQYYMTSNIEQAFSTPNTIDLTNAGMGFALTSQNIVTGVQIDDPYLFQSFTQYVYNCVLPGVSAGGLSSQALTQAGMSTTGTGNSTNSLLGYMASYTSNAGANLLTTEYSAAGGDGSPSGTTTTCGAQTLDIQNDFNTYATNEAGPQIAGALGMTYATFASQYGLVNNSIYSMSSNAMDEIIQMMAVNQYNQAMIQSANLAGVNPSQLAYGSALAQQNMSDSFSISGQMAGKYMPVIYGIFSALFLAFSLFLIILMALPIGVNYLKMYMELGLFLAVWPALMAVYNYIIDLIVQQQFTYLATQGYSLNSAHTINTFIATQLGWMGYLSWGVPMMAYALVTGSTYAMVGAISSMDNAGKKTAGAAAAQAASGNVNLGNDSMNNYGANKVNSAVQDVAGVMPRTNYAGFNKTETSPFSGDKVVSRNAGPEKSQKLYDSQGKPIVETSDNGLNQSAINKNEAKFTNADGFSETLGKRGTGDVLAASDSQFSGDYTSSRTNTLQHSWQSQMTKADSAQKGWYTDAGATQQESFKKDSGFAAVQAVSGMTKLNATKKAALDRKVTAQLREQAGGKELPLTVGGAYELAKSAGLSNSEALEYSNKYGQDLKNSVDSDSTLSAIKKGGANQNVTDSIQAAATTGESYSHSLANDTRVSAKALRPFMTDYNKKLLKNNPNLTRPELGKADDKEEKFLRTRAGQQYFSSWIAKHYGTAGINPTAVNDIKKHGDANKAAVKKSPLATPITSLNYVSTTKKIKEEKALLKKAEQPPVALQKPASTKSLMQAVNNDSKNALNNPKNKYGKLTPQQRAAYEYLKEQQLKEKEYKAGEGLAPAVNTVIAASNLLNSGIDLITGKHTFGQTGYMNPQKPAENLAKTLQALQTLNGGQMPANVQKELGKYRNKQQRIDTYNAVAVKSNNRINDAQKKLLGNAGPDTSGKIKGIKNKIGDAKQTIKKGGKNLKRAVITGFVLGGLGGLSPETSAVDNEAIPSVTPSVTGKIVSPSEGPQAPTSISGSIGYSPEVSVGTDGTGGVMQGNPYANYSTSGEGGNVTVTGKSPAAAPSFIQADTASLSAMKASGLVGSSGSGDLDLQGKTPATTQSATMVKGGKIAQEKAGGGTSKPYKIGTWISGGSSSKLPSTPSFTKSKIKTYGNTKDIKSGKVGIVNGVEYLNDKDAGLIRLGKITGGNASGTVNPVNTENPTAKAVSPVKTENPTAKAVSPVKSVSPVNTVKPTSNTENPTKKTVNPVKAVTANANPANAGASNIPATPVGVSQILSSQVNPNQLSSTASPESGDNGIPPDTTK